MPKICFLHKFPTVMRGYRLGESAAEEYFRPPTFLRWKRVLRKICLQRSRREMICSRESPDRQFEVEKKKNDCNKKQDLLWREEDSLESGRGR